MADTPITPEQELADLLSAFIVLKDDDNNPYILVNRALFGDTLPENPKEHQIFFLLEG